jgi:hypothetical protein
MAQKVPFSYLVAELLSHPLYENASLCFELPLYVGPEPVLAK